MAFLPFIEMLSDKTSIPAFIPDELEYVATNPCMVSYLLTNTFQRCILLRTQIASPGLAALIAGRIVTETNIRATHL